jgi:hypothetical protein
MHLPPRLQATAALKVLGPAIRAAQRRGLLEVAKLPSSAQRQVLEDLQKIGTAHRTTLPAEHVADETVVHGDGRGKVLPQVFEARRCRRADVEIEPGGRGRRAVTFQMVVDCGRLPVAHNPPNFFTTRTLRVASRG